MGIFGILGRFQGRLMLTAGFRMLGSSYTMLGADFLPFFCGGVLSKASPKARNA
jgi:hypothetical protein